MPQQNAKKGADCRSRAAPRGLAALLLRRERVTLGSIA